MIMYIVYVSVIWIFMNNMIVMTIIIISISRGIFTFLSLYNRFFMRIFSINLKFFLIVKYILSNLIEMLFIYLLMIKL